MVIVGVVMILVLACVVAVLLVAVLELYRDLEYLRELIGMTDQPRSLSLGPAVDTRPSAHGLPDSVDTWPRGSVLVLADICGTCALIGSELAKDPPSDPLHIVLSTRSEESAAAWVTTNNAETLLSAITVDVDDEISHRLGIQTAPAVIRIRDGRLVTARTIPSLRWLKPMLTEVEVSEVQEDSPDRDQPLQLS